MSIVLLTQFRRFFFYFQQIRFLHHFIVICLSTTQLSLVISWVSLLSLPILYHADLVQFSPALLKLQTCHISIMMLLVCKCNAIVLAISRSKELVLSYVLDIICFYFIPLGKLDFILSDYTYFIALLPLPYADSFLGCLCTFLVVSLVWHK